MKRAALVSPSDKSLYGLYLGEIFQTWSVACSEKLNSAKLL